MRKKKLELKMKKPGRALCVAALLLASASVVSAATVSPAINTHLQGSSDIYTMAQNSIFSSRYDYSVSSTGSIWQSSNSTQEEESSIPVPAAAWLFISGLVGMIGVSRRKRK
jgi:hypothetical protein